MYMVVLDGRKGQANPDFSLSGNFCSKNQSIFDGLPKQLQFFRVMRRSVDFRMQEKQLLDNILGPKIYDRRIRPGGIPGGVGGNLTSGR